MALNESEKFDSTTAAKRNMVAAIKHVASQLGNTPSICKKCYIHPEVMNAYMDGELIKMLNHKIDDKIKSEFDQLNEEEIIVLAFLKKRLKQADKKQTKH